MADFIIALCFTVVLCFIGGLAYGLIALRQATRACADTIRQIAEIVNAEPWRLPAGSDSPPRVNTDVLLAPDMPWEPSREPGPLVHLAPTTWREWDDAEETK